jgi:AcrR family transcriptional regulator
MARNAEQTRQRLLAAAAAEFSAYGIAGGKVERIAIEAQCNKAMIYTYFGSKEELFNSVFVLEVADRIRSVGFDPANLPDYAGRLFDCFDWHPFTVRLYNWYNLERPGGPALTTIGLANENKLGRLEQAQADGVVADHYSPIEMMTLLRSIAATWATLSHSSLGPYAPHERDRRRFCVVDAVERLIQHS